MQNMVAFNKTISAQVNVVAYPKRFIIYSFALQKLLSYHGITVVQNPIRSKQ